MLKSRESSFEERMIGRYKHRRESMQKSMLVQRREREKGRRAKWFCNEKKMHLLKFMETDRNIAKGELLKMNCRSPDAWESQGASRGTLRHADCLPDGCRHRREAMRLDK